MSDWEDDEWEAEKPKAAPKAATKKKACESEDESSEEEAPKPEEKKEEKAADTKVVTKNSFSELDISLQKHVDQLVNMVVPKLQKAEAKKAPHKFLTDVSRTLSVKLTTQEAEQVHKVIKEIHARRKKEEIEENKKKLEEEEAKKKEESMPKNEISDADYFASFM
eukprot:TRINITY_DN40587_c0_g1_i1.p1 TRINITY_DN40587_c0_g1~~TRINITY_DN40587_c0_g1_i1.p1  ORF type:complete len:165 (-),score=68.16 TRINITY_DN40587_c0_g1_i1:142-636(-)